MKILVLFVEPMLYGMDLIHEVYEKTKHEFRYVYCNARLTGKDNIILPENAVVLSENKSARRIQVVKEFSKFSPDFAIINGYVGTEQVTAIYYCQKNHIPYAIETDTTLHIPANPVVALAKKLLLRRRLHHPLCYGFPGGTPQKENLVYYGIPEEKNFIMPMSVSEDRLLKAAGTYASKEELKKEIGLESKKIILFVGRLAPEKNISLLISAYNQLKKKHPEAALIIVGDGPKAKDLKAQVRELSITDVLFSGYIGFPELMKYYKMADVFVLPSVYEPWGLVVNEALAFGLPVVISDKVGCGSDLVKNSENGFVFSDDTELYDGMEKALLNETLIPSAGSWNFRLYRKNFESAEEIICGRKMV